MQVNQQAKKILQGFSIFLGATGLLCLLGAIYFFVLPLKEFDLYFILFLLPFLFLCALSIAVCYRMVKNFSPRSIRELLLTISIVVYIVGSAFTENIAPLIQTESLQQRQAVFISRGLILFSTILLYKLGKNYLTKWAFSPEAEN